MKILCYGKSEFRQKAHCDFFCGAGWLAEWATDPHTAAGMLAHRRYDAIIVDPAINDTESNEIMMQVKLLNPSATVLIPPQCKSAASEDVDFTIELPALLMELDKLRCARLA